ncbi:uncharacterized protein LOC143918100 [Arctopsyche grandis]|uniref:uncharacterized protein LOC143918100 n=1 Tax=Arctopsyche grandis TaxID=121162 RepID=UPI00406D7A1F
MEAAVVDLENSVKRTDERLDMMAWKIDTVERQISEPDQNPETSVMRLLKSVTEVRNDYQNLRREILEVQELQKQVGDRLKQQVQQVHGRFSSLKERIAAVPNN